MRPLPRRSQLLQNSRGLCNRTLNLGEVFAWHDDCIESSYYELLVNIATIRASEIPLRQSEPPVTGVSTYVEGQDAKLGVSCV